LVYLLLKLNVRADFVGLGWRSACFHHENHQASSPSVRRSLGREVALLLQEPIPAAGKIKERDAKREE
jgi:hypothetical protein